VFDCKLVAPGDPSGRSDAGDTWFFITADYAFGTAMEADARAKVGGKVIGSVRQLQGATDFASALLHAQSSQAKVIGLANAGGDATNALKGASDFGIVVGGQKLAAMLIFLSDVADLAVGCLLRLLR
jgi:branched-chain amino acid transport system substrate-binding protein